MDSAQEPARPKPSSLGETAFFSVARAGPHWLSPPVPKLQREEPPLGVAPPEGPTAMEVDGLPLGAGSKALVQQLVPESRDPRPRQTAAAEAAPVGDALRGYGSDQVILCLGLGNPGNGAMHRTAAEIW